MGIRIYAVGSLHAPSGIARVRVQFLFKSFGLNSSHNMMMSAGTVNAVSFGV